MSFDLSFVDFCSVVGLESESVLTDIQTHGKRKLTKNSYQDLSSKLKESFNRLFGVTFEDAKENIDHRSWKRNIDQLNNGYDVTLGCVSGAKRKRKSFNSSLNESLLADFESASVEPSEISPVDELKRLRALVEIQQRKIESMQSVFRKTRVPTPNARNGGGSVEEYSQEAKAFAIGSMALGESATSVRRMMEQLVLVVGLQLILRMVGNLSQIERLSSWYAILLRETSGL